MIYGHDLQIDATVKQPNSNAISCTVISLSDTIIKFDCISPLDPADPVSLKMRGLNIVTAYLIWNKGKEYGCRADFAFHPAVINAVIEQSRSAEIIDPPFAGLIKTAASQRCSW